METPRKIPQNPDQRTQTLRVQIIMPANSGSEHKIPYGGDYYFLISSTGTIQSAVGEDFLTVLPKGAVRYLPENVAIGKDSRFLKFTSTIGGDVVTIGIGFGKELPLDLILAAIAAPGYAPPEGVIFAGSVAPGAGVFLPLVGNLASYKIAYLELAQVGAGGVAMYGGIEGGNFEVGANNTPVKPYVTGGPPWAINWFDIDGNPATGFQSSAKMPNTVGQYRANVTGYNGVSLYNLDGVTNVNYTLMLVPNGEL